MTRTERHDRPAPADPAAPRRRGRRTTRAAAVAALAVACTLGTAGPADAAPNHWGAIAMSASTGRTGYSWDHPTSRAATRAAAGKCGVADCRAVVWVANGCAALAQAPDTSLGWGYGASRASAGSQARKGTGRRGAHVLGVVCTTRYR